MANPWDVANARYGAKTGVVPTSYSQHTNPWDAANKAAIIATKQVDPLAEKNKKDQQMLQQQQDQAQKDKGLFGKNTILGQLIPHKEGNYIVPGEAISAPVNLAKGAVNFIAGNALNQIKDIGSAYASGKQVDKNYAQAQQLIEQAHQEQDAKKRQQLVLQSVKAAAKVTPFIEHSQALAQATNKELQGRALGTALDIFNLTPFGLEGLLAKSIPKLGTSLVENIAKNGLKSPTVQKAIAKTIVKGTAAGYGYGTAYGTAGRLQAGQGYSQSVTGAATNEGVIGAGIGAAGGLLTAGVAASSAKGFSVEPVQPKEIPFKQPVPEVPNPNGTPLDATGRPIVPATNEGQRVITHNSRVPVSQIATQGVAFGDNTPAGKGMYFSETPGQKALYSSGEGKTIELNANDFKLLKLNSFKEEQSLLQRTGKKTLTDAALSEGYQGIERTHPDPSIGSTIIISDKSALDTAIKQKYGTQTAETKAVTAPILQEARKYKSAEEFVKAVQNESNISLQGKLETIPLNKISGSDYTELDSALKKGKISLQDAQNLLPDNEINMANSKVSMPIEVRKNADGTYSLVAGNHRVAQQLVNGEKTILANIQNENGFSTKSQLTDIWKQAHQLSEAPTVPTTVSVPQPIGTGEKKVSKLAQGIEEKAVQQKLVKSFGDLPQYETVTWKDQAAKSVSLVQSDYAKAKDIAMGKEQPPKGLLPEAVLTAVENKALAEGDVATLRELGTMSTRPQEASLMGQRIGVLSQRNPESVVGAISDIAKAREARAKKINKITNINKEKNKIVKEIQSNVKKPTKETWQSFISSLQC